MGMTSKLRRKMIPAMKMNNSRNSMMLKQFHQDTSGRTQLRSQLMENSCCKLGMRANTGSPMTHIAQ